MNWPLIVLALLVAGGCWFILRRRTPDKTNLGVVIGLLNDITFNQKLIATMTAESPVKKKFKIYNWNKTQDKMVFLAPGLQSKINVVFSLAAEYNSRYEAGYKNNQPVSLSQDELGPLNATLTEVKTALINWLKEDLESENAGKNNRGVLGSK
jgi:hypothetical protein